MFIKDSEELISDNITHFKKNREFEIEKYKFFP